MNEKAIVQFINEKNGQIMDIEVPLNITANELIAALNVGLRLGINVNDESKCHLVSENPVALLMGDNILEDIGIKDGSKIIFKGL